MNLKSWRYLKVHLKNSEDIVKFGELLGLPLTEATRDIWFYKKGGLMKKKSSIAREKQGVEVYDEESFAQTLGMGKRRLSKSEIVDKLIELGKQAKKLYKQTEQSETAAKKLGELLLEVKKHNPHGGLKKWIQETIGRDESTRNRCNYAISLANGKRAKKKAAAKAAQMDEVIAINKALTSLTKSALLGWTLEARAASNIIVNAVAELVKKAEAIHEKYGLRKPGDLKPRKYDRLAAVLAEAASSEQSTAAAG